MGGEMLILHSFTRKRRRLRASLFALYGPNDLPYVYNTSQGRKHWHCTGFEDVVPELAIASFVGI